MFLETLKYRCNFCEYCTLSNIFKPYFNFFSEMARNALHWWEIRRAVLRRDSDLAQLESLVRSARLPDDYFLDYQARIANTCRTF